MVFAFPMDKIKAELVSKNILITMEGTETYTTRMQFITEMGQPLRSRMLRFSRDAVRCLMNLDFIELCELTNEKNKKLGGNNNEDQAW